MKSIFYGVYYLGATVGSLCALTMEPLLACVFIMLIPVALMTAAVASGKVRFYSRGPNEEVDPERRAFPTLAAIDDEDLDDKEAFEKYGHQIAIELDAFRAMLMSRVAEIDHARQQYEKIMQRAK